MGNVNCLHPNCSEALARGRICCNRHWYSLPEELRSRLPRAKEGAGLGELTDDIIEHFQEHLIGDHEIVACRGRAPEYNGCGNLIVWLPSKSGKMLPVDFEAVEAEDDAISKKHTLHFKTCTAVQQRR